MLASWAGVLLLCCHGCCCMRVVKFAWEWFLFEAMHAAQATTPAPYASWAHEGKLEQIAGKMSLLTMPMLIINMGAEMLYILEQRLNAQEIASDKGFKVLLDITSCMFNKEYMKVLFKPQEVYPLLAVRKIFERMAHSSIMRLSDTSMDKLYDLMIMGFKYQLVCSCALDSMLQVTYTHLSQLRHMLAPLPGSAACIDMLEGVQEQVHQTYGSLGIGALHLLRQSLLRFFQDRRVKVSLFLQEGVQSTAGRLILHNPNGPRVGSVTYYDSSGGVEAQEKLKLKALEIEPVEFFIHPVQLGVNLYSGKRQKVVPPARKGDALTAPLLPTDELVLAGEAKSQCAEDYRAASSGASAKQELGLLSALLAVKSQNDNFKLNLFDDGDGASSTSRARPAGALSVQLGQVESLQFSQTQSTYKTGMMAALKLDEQPVSASRKLKASDDEDLLDLLGE